LEGLWGSSSSTTTTKTEDVDLEEDLVDDTVSDGDEEVLLSTWTPSTSAATSPT